VILKGLEISPYGTNCYIVGSESTKESMVIDPGGSGDGILKYVTELGLKTKYIVLTHGHIDHIGGVSELKELTGAEFCVHTDEGPIFQGQPLSAVLGMRYPEMPTPDRWLKGGDSIDIGDLHFTVLHTPGHSPGGICLVGEGVVFSGDTLFNQGIGRTDFPTGSQSQLMDSIHTKLMVLPDNTVVYPGHGPATTIGDERQANPWLRGM